VSRIEITGLSSSGRKKADPNTPRLSSSPAATKPPPTNAPVKPCVVEMGKPSSAARITVMPAPVPTASRKIGEAASASGTSPLPEKALMSASAKKTDATQPKNVAIVASVIAVL
jgi:hypothetical protein